MRRADIKVGEEYAVVERQYHQPKRGRVVRFGVTRRSIKDWSTSVTHDGILVALLDPETGVPLEGPAPGVSMAVVVTSRGVLRPWSEQIEIDRRKSERKEAEAQAYIDDHRWLGEAAEALGLDREDLRFVTSSRDRVALSREALERAVSHVRSGA